MNRFEQAVALAESGRYSDAIELFEQVLADDPRNPDILYNLGMCFTEIDRPDRAVTALTKSIEHNPKHANSYVALGYACFRLDDVDKAITHLRHALSLDPDNPYALRNLGGLYGKLGDLDESVAYLEKAYRINPSDPATVYGLACAYWQSQDTAKADNYYRKVLEMDSPPNLKELARDGLREIAITHLTSRGLRMDAVMYMLSALELFEEESEDRIQAITFEIAIKGRAGLDINNPDKEYTIGSLPGTFTGLQLVSYMYVGFKTIDPDQDIGIDLSREYEAALRLFEDREKI